MSQKNYPKKIVMHYIDTISEHITVSKVVLFGSFAYGKPDESSDVDLIVESCPWSMGKSRESCRKKMRWT